MSQKSRTNSRDLSRTIDIIIGIDIRDGKSGTYEPTTEESIVPRSRHTDRDSTKVSQKDILEELIASRYRVTNKSEVNIEDFLTLGKEQRSTMPVYYKGLPAAKLSELFKSRIPPSSTERSTTETIEEDGTNRRISDIRENSRNQYGGVAEMKSNELKRIPRSPDPEAEPQRRKRQFVRHQSPQRQYRRPIIVTPAPDVKVSSSADSG